MNIILHKLDKL